MNFSQITSKLSPRSWLMVGGSAVATIVFVYMLFSLASAPSYTTLLAGVNPAQTGKITSALSAAGVAYQLQNNGTAVAVESGEQAQARVTLATAGLLDSSGTSNGLSGFTTSSGLGQSNFQQQVAYESALEQQLDSTIDQIQGVSSANVQLAIPTQTDQLFSDSSTSPSASILIDDSGGAGPSSVKGIADLVASAITGLSSAKVTITDQSGQLLWPASGLSASGLMAKEGAESAYDTQTANEVDAMLAATLGPGKAVVQVNADLNTDQTSFESVAYSKTGTPLTRTTGAETLTGATPTSTANGVPSYTAASSGNSKYKDLTSNETFGVAKKVTQEVVAPGAINQQSVSVLVSNKVPASELPAITSAVTAAAGINKKRGDTIAVSQIAFAPVATATAAASSPLKMIGYAKYALVGLGALFFLFFMSRMLKRRENEAFAGTPTWLRELEAPRSLASLEAGLNSDDPDADAKVKQLRSPVNIARQQVDELIARDPDRVASQVRQWMAED